MKNKKGWLWLYNSRKVHYFDDDLHSLCGKWMVFSLEDCMDNNHNSPDNCKECMRRRNKKYGEVKE